MIFRPLRYLCIFGCISKAVKPYSSLRNNPLLTLCEPARLRSYLEYEMHKTCKPIPYHTSKQILHTKLKRFDIYGDNQGSLNVEHVFPQSFFKQDTRRVTMRSDLHNLYLCNMKLNSYRQNFKYVDSTVTKLNDKIRVLDSAGEQVTNETDLFSKRGYVMVTNKSSKTFIPSDQSRGKIARALSYFVVKYNYLEELSKVIDIQTLLEWNLKDPVDNDEYLKNIVIYKHQGDINPFILDSDLVTFCFSDQCEIDETLLLKKRTSTIDPFFTIDYLLHEIKSLEKDKQEMQSLLVKKWKLGDVPRGE